MIDIMRIACLSCRKIGKLGRDGFSDHYCALLTTQGNAGGVPQRLAIPIRGKPQSGRHVVGIDDVLNGDRNAVKRALGRKAIGISCSLKSAIGVQMLPGADLTFTRRDPVETCRDQGLG